VGFRFSELDSLSALGGPLRYSNRGPGQRNRSAPVSLGRFTERCRTFELMAKSEHLNLKSGASAKAIPRRYQNGH
jgi:hypothetical protein